MWHMMPLDTRRPCGCCLLVDRAIRNPNVDLPARSNRLADQLPPCGREDVMNK
jgi:hypothetical protein